MRRIILAIILLLCSLPVLAQSDAEEGRESNSTIERVIQNQLSAPNRQIRLSGVEGALTSDATIDEITIADREGVWLRVEDVRIIWTRLALLRGRLEINNLTAARLDVIRKPLADENLPTPEATPLQLPDLPVAIHIEAFELPSAHFDQDIFGLESEISATGSVNLAEGSLAAGIAVDRTDGPGGRFVLDASYQRETEQLDIDLKLQEPRDGIIANMLDMEGRPQISVSLSGSGPIGNVDLALTFDADGERILTGTTRLRRDDDGLRFDADLSGPVARAVPAAYRQFFGAETQLETEGVVKSAGGVVVERFDLDAEQLSLEASAETGNGFLQRLKLRGRIAASDGSPVVLPVSGGQTRLEDALVEIDFGSDTGGAWSARLEANGFSAEEIEIAKISFLADGLAQALDNPAARSIMFKGSGSITGVEADDPAVAQALGEQVDLLIDGRWTAGSPIALREASITARQLLVTTNGEIDDYAFTGDLSIRTSDLAPFSGLLGQNVSGRARVAARGEVTPLSGSFDLTLHGELGDLSLENEALNGLLSGTTTITGGFGRNESGFQTRDFRIANPQFRFTADGEFATGQADFDFESVVNDLAALSEKVSGELTAKGFARGADGQIGLSVQIAVPQGSLFEKTLSNAAVSFSGARSSGETTGQIAGGVQLGGEQVELRSEIAMRVDGSRSLNGLRLTAKGAEISGSLTQSAKGLLDGSLDIDALDITTLAALFLQEAAGSVEAQLALSSGDGMQNATINATLDDASVETIRIAAGRADFGISNLFGVPMANGTLTASGVTVGGVAVTSLDMTAQHSGEETTLGANAIFDTGAHAELDGVLTPLDDGIALAIREFSLTQRGTQAVLREPARISLAGETIAIEPLRLGVGDGSLSVSGEISEQLSLDLRIDALPLDIANSVNPDLGLQGRVSGTATVVGTRERPRIRFDARADGVSADQLRSAGLQPLTVTANGETDANRLAVAAEAFNADGVRAQANGTVPLSQGSLDLVVKGNAPLALADRFLADTGAQAAGSLQFDVRIGGSFDNPALEGNIAANGAQFFDPQSGVRLRDIDLSATLSPQAVQITQARARLGDGGTVGAAGQISLETNFPANIQITLDDARYRRADLLSVLLDGRLTVTGALLRDPVIGGTITVDEAEIMVPERLGGGAAGIKVRHVAPPPPVASTLERARTGGGVPAPTARPSIVQLDISINAPRRVFVRGRGLDAEMGGSLRIVGPVSDIRPVGGFDLVRGRVSILGQRIVFDEGSVQLIGSLDPVLRFVANTSRGDITVVITITGRASDPEIVLSSQPALPEDEVLAQLIFNRGLNELSALQIARLAAAAAELAGSGSSLTSKFRKATGLDDIDIYTNQKGETAVRAGRYIRDNIYLGVEAGSGGETRGTINLDLTDTLKAKGSVSSDGNSGIGLFFEKDY